MTDSNQDVNLSNKTLIGLSVGILVIFLGLVAFLFFWVQRKNGGKLVFPSGINYTGQQETQEAPKRPNYDFAKISASVSYTPFESPKVQYKFEHNAELIPLIIPGDSNDSMTFDVADTPANFNLMALVETISYYNPKMTGKQVDFVKNYFTFFGGMKGLSKIESFKNTKGLTGFKANYIFQDDKAGPDNYFFIFPDKPDKILHLINIFPAEGQPIFNHILNSVELVK